ncbi:retinoid-inducible serine carboxypeptidase-like [Chrysoperla carnea]|uniref:retinoid-inducible serine carboxypeptidase-like n=1 Tax=Chrysoperla carnea TaxID=189513 RepID=UPI001D078AB9|nr:retinoid-inducible serine carboxypeptidase-like [Chrysoperla carnea]
MYKCYLNMKLVILFLFIISVCWCKQGFGPGEQDWDYAEVRKGAHMFWWLYYTTADVEKPESKPLIIWLQGGPGGSSTGYGNFEELGPLDSNLNPRNHTWVKDYNVIFIDNPVGTGFSYVDSTSLLTTNNAQIARDLVECLRSFYKKLPQFESTPLYITSESYGGKMDIEFALLLDQEIKEGKIKSNLKGVTLIDSWISPIDSVLTWAPFLLETGMIDIDGYERIDKEARKCQDLLDSGRYTEATNQWSQTETVIFSVTQNIDFYNILTKVKGYPIRYNSNFVHGLQLRQASDSLNSIMNNEVKKALNLSSDIYWTESNGQVFSTLGEDFMKPVIHIVEEVLNTTSIKVQVVSGQLDLIVDTPGTYKWVMDMHFKDKRNWLNAKRKPLLANRYIEGYVKKYGTFEFYWVSRSGHMVPADNPYAMAKILENLTNE